MLALVNDNSELFPCHCLRLWSVGLYNGLVAVIAAESATAVMS